MKVEEFIEVLKTFPQDAEICLTDESGANEGTFLFGVIADSENDWESGYGYSEVAIVPLYGYSQNYPDLVNEERKLYGNKVWYNTGDYVETWDCNNQRVKLYFNPETNKFEKERNLVRC